MSTPPGSKRGPVGALVAAVSCILAAGLIYLCWSAPEEVSRFLRRPSAPAADAQGLWTWAAADPGLNVYVARRRVASRDDLDTVWVKREYFRSPAGISKNLIELHEFDCSRNASRQLLSSDNPGPAAQGASEWVVARRGTADERVLHLVCGDPAPRSALRLPATG